MEFFSIFRYFRQFLAILGNFWPFSAFVGIFRHFSGFFSIFWHLLEFFSIFRHFRQFVAIVSNPWQFSAFLGHFFGPRLIGVPSGTQRYNQFLSRTPGSMKTGISVSLFPPGQPGMGAQFGIWVPVDQGAQAAQRCNQFRSRTPKKYKNRCLQYSFSKPDQPREVGRYGIWLSSGEEGCGEGLPQAGVPS